MNDHKDNQFGDAVLDLGIIYDSKFSFIVHIENRLRKSFKYWDIYISNVL